MSPWRPGKEERKSGRGEREKRRQLSAQYIKRRWPWGFPYSKTPSGGVSLYRFTKYHGVSRI